MEYPVPRLPTTLFELGFTVLDPIVLRDYPGAKWRGLAGTALRVAVCHYPQRACQRCEERFDCAYAVFYKAFRPEWAEKMRRYESVPRPWVVKGELGPIEARAGDRLRVRLAVFGSAQQYARSILRAFAHGAHRGLSRRGQRMRLDAVTQIDPNHSGQQQDLLVDGGIAPPLPTSIIQPPKLPQHGRIRLTLETPLRIEREQTIGRKKQPQRISAAELRFVDLFGPLLRRCSMLTYFYTDTALETDFRGLNASAQDIQFIGRQLSEFRCGRYSSSQRKWLDKSGYVGWLDLPANGLASFWPYLWIGQFTHIGYGTTLGMGGYSVSHLGL